MRRESKGLTLIIKRVPDWDRPGAGGPWLVVNVLVGKRRPPYPCIPRIFFASECVSSPGWIARLYAMAKAGCPTPILLDFCRDHGFVDREPTPEDVLC